MKKILAIALALVMMLAVCVPAFAADEFKTINGTAGEDNTAIVKTSTTDEDGNSVAKYSVTFPAVTEIPWNTDSKTIKYTVTAQLEAGKSLSVSVAGNGKMTAAGVGDLAYTLGGDTSISTTVNTVVRDEEHSLTVDVAQAAWDNAVVAEYSDTLTFTAEVK